MLRHLLLAAGIVPCLALSAQATVFDFDSISQGVTCPLDQISEGITAHFTGAYFISQPSYVVAPNPAGFDANCLMPTGISTGDLTITFSVPLSNFSIYCAPQELATDSSARLRVTTYMDATLVGTATHLAPNPGTWPSNLLSYNNPAGFNRAVVHYDAVPPTGGDYGTIFIADTVSVTAAVPEPASLSLMALGALALLRRGRNR